MIAELLSVLSILLGGCLLLRAGGIRGWGLIPLGFIAGTAAFVTIGLLQVVTVLPTTPVLTLVLVVVLPAMWWLYRHVQGHDVFVAPGQAVHTVLTVVLLVIVLRGANLVSWHVDSFRYVMTGALLADGNYRELVSENLLTKRLLSVPILHTPATLADEYYLRSLVPLLALAIMGALAWLYWNGVRDRVGPVTLIGIGALGVALLVTNNRFVFHAFYINGHLFFAALLLAIVGCAWLLATNRTLPEPGLLTLLLVSIPALVVTRPEASIVAGVALLPFVVSARIAVAHRIAALAVLGGSVALWHGLIVVIQLTGGSSLPFSAVGGLTLGVVILLLIPVMLWRTLPRFGGLILVTAEMLLWLALIALAVRDPANLRTSLRATAENVLLGAGSWGLSLVALAVLGAGVFVLLKAQEQIFLRYPLTTFVPLAFLFAYLRDSPYRVGDGDSLNRMLIQVVPLATLYVIVAMASGVWRVPRIRRQARKVREAEAATERMSAAG